jgi:hypothetical protein
MTKCFLCDSNNIIIKRGNNNIIYSVNCKKCGKYRISDILVKAFENKPASREIRDAVIWFLSFNTDPLITEDIANENDIEGGVPISHIIQEYKKHKQS